MYEFLRLATLAWIGLGVPIALYLVGPGLGRLKLNAAPASPGFRVLIIPGAVLLWPILAWAFVSASSKT